MSDLRPLLASIKVRLGLVVAVSVLVASLLAATAASAGVAVWVVVPVTVALALLVTQLVAHGMTQPLRQMTVAATALARGQDAGPVRQDAPGEIGELGRAFTAMAADLRSQDRQRRDLVANVSHELRTPVAALHAVLENLADGVQQPTPETLSAALRQTERLSRLVQDLLDLSRLDAGVVELDLAPVDPAVLVAEVLAEADLAGRGVRHDASVPDGLLLRGDGPRLHQMLANLVDNAGRHSPAGGTVHVRVAALPGPGDWIGVEIADDGPGIPAQERERVFDRFVTGAGTSTTVGTGGRPGETTRGGTGGTGLGLAIARWVAMLHGGSVDVADTMSGCLMRVVLPLDGPAPAPAPSPAPAPTSPTTQQRSAAMSPTPPGPPRPAPTGAPVPATPAAALPAGSDAMSSAFGALWPERAREGRPLLVVAALAAGLVAGLTVPDHLWGLGVSVTLLVMTAVASWPARHRLSRLDGVMLAAAVLLSLVPTLRASGWLLVLSVVAACALVGSTLARAHSLTGIVASGLAYPLAGIRGLPWLGRSLDRFVGGTSWRAARTVAVSALLLVVVGGLLASADAVLASWVDALVPDVRLDELYARTFTTIVVAAITLAGVYVALNPPRLGVLDRAPAPTRHRWEWLAPVLVTDGVLAAFVVAQAAALFGGDAYVQRTTGLTYADYVHQGFAQLCVVTVLCIGVGAAVARRAAGDDRMPARALLLLLGVLTLVVVASALHRMSVYEDAYGATRLRLVVTFFEGWLGLVVLMMLVGLALWRGAWLARAALLSGSLTLLVLAGMNPDAWIATHNLHREGPVPVDSRYLGGLSADAVTALPTGEARSRICARLEGDDLFSWNLGRARARSLCGG